MIFKRIDIDTENNVYLNCYLHEKVPKWNYGFDRPAVVVCPGGGYGMCSPREADPIALQYSAKGYNTFVLYYTVGENAVFPKPLIDLSVALKIIRENAKEWGIIPDKIAVCGFSAGGHLTASLGVHWNLPEVMEKADCKNGENEPNALILCYPVITTRSWMKPHIARLAGDRDLIEAEKLLDVSLNVGAHTPPSFLTHTFMDDAVSVEESMDFARALDNNNIPFELHIFPEGGHGLATGDKQTCTKFFPSFNKWIELSVLWLENVFDDEEKPDRTKRSRQTS
ncbi:MAG: alpha/beta hydrolase [Clostridia bacterium]|nr:alpha/beta hydrolase [Clostridia bacterium]